jgi:hypothetical protein
MRAPNILIYLLTIILAFVGVWENLGAPVKIPNFTLPLIGSSKDVIEPFLAAHSFGLVCAAASTEKGRRRCIGAGLTPQA